MLDLPKLLVRKDIHKALTKVINYETLFIGNAGDSSRGAVNDLCSRFRRTDQSSSMFETGLLLYLSMFYAGCRRRKRQVNILLFLLIG
jgi:hypothetical protein